MPKSNSNPPQRKRALGFETLESRQLMAVLIQADVKQLLARAAAASARQDAIIAVVDRRGEILGVRVEGQVFVNIPDSNVLVFAIDGAVAKARTAAFFANDQAPLTSRSVRFISQSTITQREVQSNPNVASLASSFRGPGYVAPIGVASTFPAGVNNTGLVDLLGIEHSNRDGIAHPGADGVKGTADDFPAYRFRFNIANDGRVPVAVSNPSDPNSISPDEYLRDAPDSFGYDSGLFQNAQSRGIATLPGGIPLYIGNELVGGIGVFFPGTDGTATFEQNFVPAANQPNLTQVQIENARLNAPLVLQSEYIAFAAAGGVQTPIGGIDPVARVLFKPKDLDLSTNRIDLVGITVEIFGPGNSVNQGIPKLLQVGAAAGTEVVSLVDNTQNLIVSRLGPDRKLGTADDVDLRFRRGSPVPDGWLVTPTNGAGITASQVSEIINRGIAQANVTRAAIRLPIGSSVKMVFAVADRNGVIVGLYRMPDATVFSIDVAVAKARNVSYYNSSNLVEADKPNDPIDPTTTPTLTAYTSRTFRYLASARYPTGTAVGIPPGAFSSLNAPGINPATAENTGAPLPASAYLQNSTPELMYDSFRPQSNFRDPRTNLPRSNGVIFFPGSTGIYSGYSLLGGFGVSGDGVDQDDVVTTGGSINFAAPPAIRADMYFIRNVRLPYSKFNRNPLL